MYRSASLRIWLGALALAAGSLSVAPAAEPQEKVRVTVVAILATSRNKAIDDELQDLAREIQKVEPQLTGFRRGRMTRESVAVGKPRKFPLVDDEVATVVVQQACGKDGRVSLAIKPPQVGEIVYSTCCGKYFPIVTRYQTKGKERLIIAILVQRCNK